MPVSAYTSPNQLLIIPCLGVQYYSHVTRTRYPGKDPTLEEASEALEIAGVVRRFGRKFFDLH